MDHQQLYKMRNANGRRKEVQAVEATNRRLRQRRDLHAEHRQLDIENEETVPNDIQPPTGLLEDKQTKITYLAKQIKYYEQFCKWRKEKEQKRNQTIKTRPFTSVVAVNIFLSPQDHLLPPRTKNALVKQANKISSPPRTRSQRAMVSAPLQIPANKTVILKKTVRPQILRKLKIAATIKTDANETNNTTRNGVFQLDGSIITSTAQKSTKSRSTIHQATDTIFSPIEQLHRSKLQAVLPTNMTPKATLGVRRRTGLLSPQTSTKKNTPHKTAHSRTPNTCVTIDAKTNTQPNVPEPMATKTSIASTSSKAHTPAAYLKTSAKKFKKKG